MTTLKYALLSAFSLTHMFEPQVLKLAHKEIQNFPEIKDYGSSFFWCRTKKENRREYEKNKAKHAELVAQYNIPCTKSLLVNLLKKKLQLPMNERVQ